MQMVVARKIDKLGIRLDTTELNKNVRRIHFPLTTIEEISATINKSKFFTKLGCQKGFWQIKLSERTRRYSYLVLPFGLCLAWEHFQQIMIEVEVSMVDIFFHSETEPELKNLESLVLAALQNSEFTLNN